MLAVVHGSAAASSKWSRRKECERKFFMRPLDLKMMKDDSNLRWQSEPALNEEKLADGG
jgi:hypothetical protein